MTETFDLPDDLLHEAQKATGFDSASETVVFALRELVRRAGNGDLKRFLRTVDFEFDLTKLRKLDRRRLGR